jgi:DNA-binding transcriptional regulator GbsR (MarR family)
MPGGRLTQQDRERIASGLAEGLGFAEIARRLGRPTSTVSREVDRNGGLRGYEADHAHQATGARARRRKPAAPHTAASAADAYGRDPAAVNGFAEQFAATMVQTGVPRMAARVLACLVTTDSGALTAAELVQRLQVSPASISKAVGYLENLDLIQRELDARSRRERYFIDDEMWLRTWLTSARTHAALADIAADGVKILDAATPAGARMEYMSRFFTALADDMSGGPMAERFIDALTVLAALLHSRAPLTTLQLATALDWPRARVADAIEIAEQHPDISDPAILVRAEPDAYTVEAKPGRLTAAQRQALTR